MEFPTPIVTEITAPNTVPFQPGQDVIGIGSQLPPELQAAGVTAAMVFYNSIWNTASTTPQVKFHYIASFGGNIQVGYGYSLNPSTTPTATVVANTIFTANAFTGLINNSLLVYNVNPTPAAQKRIFMASEEGTGAASGSALMQLNYGDGGTATIGALMFQLGAIAAGFTDPEFYMQNKAGTNYFRIRVLGATKEVAEILQTPDGASTWSRTVAQMIVDSWIVRENAWTTVTPAAGVTATAQFRKNSDGTVSMRRNFATAINATNGQLLTTLPAGYRPAFDCQFFIPCPNRTCTVFQKLAIFAATGNVNIFDCLTTAVVDASADPVRFSTI